MTSQISKLGTAKTRQARAKETRKNFLPSKAGCSSSCRCSSVSLFGLLSPPFHRPPPEGSGDTEEFVSLARSLIADASVLVDTATSADVAPGALEELAEACSTFSAKTVTFVHAARGNLFDPNSDTKKRFAEASLGLDSVLDSLLDVVLEFMAKYPQAKSQKRPEVAEPVKSQPVAIPQETETIEHQVAVPEPEPEPEPEPALTEPAPEEGQKVPPKRSARRPAPPPPSVPPLLSPISPRSVPSFSPTSLPRPESPRRRPTDLVCTYH